MTVPFVEYILNPTIREGASKGEINAALTKKKTNEFFFIAPSRVRGHARHDVI